MNITSLPRVTLTTLLITFAGQVHGGSFFSDFNSGVPTGVTLHGSAFVDLLPDGNGALKLTEAVFDQIGSIVIDDLDNGQTVHGFHATFRLLIGGGSQADGFSFNFAKDLPDWTISEEGEGSGLSICFDTYDNGDGEAPAIDVKFGRVTLGSTKGMDQLFRTGEFVDVVIHLDRDHTLDVIVNGTSVYDNFSLPYLPMPGRFGLGARTGGLTDNHYVDDLAISTEASGISMNVTTVSSTYSYEGTESREDLLAVIEGSPLLCQESLISGRDFGGGDSACGFLGLNDLGYYLKFDFVVAACQAGPWSFRVGPDFGRGGVIFVDGVMLASQTGDLFWSYDWNSPSVLQVNDLVLSRGAHQVEVFGFEDCCADVSPLEYQVGSGGWQSATLASFADSDQNKDGFSDCFLALSGVFDQCARKNQSIGPLSFTVNDSPAAPETVLVTATSSNPALIPAQGIVLEGSGVNRFLRLTPATDQIGTALITIHALAGNGESVSQSFIVTVSDAFILNGDFECGAEDFVMWAGGLGGGNPTEVPGWQSIGGAGINPITPEGPDAAPYRDNGDNSTHVAFMQGAVTLYQEVPGLIKGGQYILSLDYNARNCCGDLPLGAVSVNGTTSWLSPGPIYPVGDRNPWHHADILVTAPATEIQLAIQSIPASGGDATLLIDNVQLRAVTVIIGDCDSGVIDRTIDESGTVISGRIAQCAAAARNHGDFISCLAQALNGLQQDGLISQNEKVSLLKCASNPGKAEGTFNAAEDFSTSQGSRNWYYLVWTGTHYEPMTFGVNHWGGISWHAFCPLTDCGNNCLDGVLLFDTGHPNGCDHAPARTWMSPANGVVRITGNARKLDVGGGDGVEVDILKNEELLWQRKIAFDGSVGYDFDLTVRLQKSDKLYFRLHQLTDNNYDSTYFNPTIAFSARGSARD